MKSKALLMALVVMLLGMSSQRETEDFPDYITKNDDYYVTRIGRVPKIDEDNYRLQVNGAIQNPKSYTLEELYELPMQELPLTVECIGNSPNGPLLSTAVWKGFLLYDFLSSLGLDDNAAAVRYEGADGYFASHTLEQIKNNHVLAALYMNGETIPPLHGFPLRILNPGFHGVKQPAWITTITVLKKGIQDYWELRGWDCSPPMAVDSTIFFPKKRINLRGNQLRIGGAAFGGTRIAKVEVTTNKGRTWKEAEIIKSMDADHVWVFWEAVLTLRQPGKYAINVRATDIHGNSQQEKDPDHYDGTNDWPLLTVVIK